MERYIQKRKNWKRIKIKSIWDEDIKILNKFKKNMWRKEINFFLRNELGPVLIHVEHTLVIILLHKTPFRFIFRPFITEFTDTCNYNNYNDIYNYNNHNSNDNNNKYYYNNNNFIMIIIMIIIIVIMMIIIIMKKKMILITIEAARK